MSDANNAPQYDNPNTAGLNSSGPFNESAASGVSFSTISKMIGDATLMLANAGGDLTIADIKRLKAQIRHLNTLTDKQSAPPYYEHMKTRLAGLIDADAGNVGMKFLEAMQNTGCKIEVDKDLKAMASYTSYSYAKINRGFPNTVTLNPSRVDDEDEFISSSVHEFFHALQKHSAPALHLSPFNPDTRAIIHPADWIMLEAACERDAYTKQAFINSLLAKESPNVIKVTAADIVTPAEFVAARNEAASFDDAMVKVALNSLSKPTIAAKPNGRTFINNYQDVALGNYAAGMAMRKHENETGLVFLRLELPDLWKVGNYGVGPNSFGERVMEPLFMSRHPLRKDAQKLLDSICQTYGIPPLEVCMTVREYMADQKPEVVLATHHMPESAAAHFANAVTNSLPSLHTVATIQAGQHAAPANHI